MLDNKILCRTMDFFTPFGRFVYLKRSYLAPLYWFGVLLLWELNLYWTACSGIVRFLPGIGFTLAYAAVLTILVNLPGWTGRIFGWILPPLMATVYCVQLVYYEIFGSFLSLAFVSAGGDAVATFSHIMFAAIWRQASSPTPLSRQSGISIGNFLSPP